MIYNIYFQVVQYYLSYSVKLSSLLLPMKQRNAWIIVYSIYVQVVQFNLPFSIKLSLSRNSYVKLGVKNHKLSTFNINYQQIQYGGFIGEKKI